VNGEAQEGFSTALGLLFLQRMWQIRAFEDATQRLFTSGMVRGSTHLCQGQEAVVVGACGALTDGDTMLCTYRGHGAVLAMGAPVDRTFGEILGKRDGLCRGKGGSMHLTDVSVGALGSFAIVGSHLPISLGTAFAARYQGSESVTLCFFGDGTANIGAFHESLNLAAIWQLPVIFVCENNLYGEYTPIARTTPIESLADRADSYRMSKARIDGNDVGEVYKQVLSAVSAARKGAGPTLIEALTYRHKGHSRSDPGLYRPREEVESWLKRDPILRLEAELGAAGVAGDELERVQSAAVSTVSAALERALAWEEPDVSSRHEDVWA
jgi:pyruvate dehydrogenase E1 component alpha subunit